MSWLTRFMRIAPVNAAISAEDLQVRTPHVSAYLTLARRTLEQARLQRHMRMLNDAQQRARQVS